MEFYQYLLVNVVCQINFQRFEQYFTKQWYNSRKLRGILCKNPVVYGFEDYL